MNQKPKTTLNKKLLSKQKCVDQLSNFLTKKYGNVFKDKSYTNKQLINDLSTNFKDHEIKGFTLSTALVKYEKLILEKVSKYESKQIYGLEMDQIKELLPKQKEIEAPTIDRPNNKSTGQLLHSFTLPEANKKKGPEDTSIPYSQEKMAKLRLKENDVWALKAKKEHEMFLQEENQKKKSLEESKRKQKEMLEQQIKEKEIQKQKAKQDDYDFYMKNNNYQHQIGSEDNSRLNQHKIPPKADILSKKAETSSNRERPMTKDQMIDKQYYEQMKKDILNGELNDKEKKKQQREQYQQLVKDNENHLKIKKEMQEQERLNQNQMYLKAKNPFTDMSNEENIDHNISNPHPNCITPKESVLQKKDQWMKDYETQKLQREMKERELLDKQKDDDQKNKKKKMMEEFKQGLNAQVNEKKLKNEATKLNKNKELVDSNQMNDLYQKDMKKNTQDKANKINQYRHQLDMQVNTKDNN